MGTHHETVELIDGRFIYISAPNILQHHRILHIYSHLLKLASQYSIYPEEADFTLYPKFREIYHELAILLHPEFNPEELSFVNRHNFFICGQPVLHPKTQELVPGLSGIHKLLGFNLDESDDSAGEIEDIDDIEFTSTGDSALDIITDTLLIFKKNAWKLVENYSLADLSKICKQASSRLRAAQEVAESEAKAKKTPQNLQMPKPLNNTKTEATKPVDSNSMEALRTMGIPLPPI